MKTLTIGRRPHKCAGLLITAIIVLTSGCVGLPAAAPLPTRTATATVVATAAGAATGTRAAVSTATATAAGPTRTVAAPTRTASGATRTVAVPTRTAAGPTRTVAAATRTTAGPTRTMAAPTRTAATANTPPTAENISTSTRPSTAVAITLKGRDNEGDSLTYSVVRQPSKGSLSGAAPFLTYRAGPSLSGTDSFTYKVNDGKTDSAIATVQITIESLRWARRGPVVINVEKAPLAYHGGGSTPGYFTEARFTGKFTVYRLTETSIAVDDRDVDHGIQFYNVTIRSGFDAPPAVLVPGDVHTLTVQFSHSGTVSQGSPGATFQYSADRNNSIALQPREPLAYAPWSSSFSGASSKAWRLTVPYGQIGDTLQISAGWWNCGVCNVTWTYMPE